MLKNLNPLKNSTIFRALTILLLGILIPAHTHASPIRTEANGGLELGSYTEQSQITGWLDSFQATLSTPINLFGTTYSNLYVCAQGLISNSSGVVNNVDYTIPANNNVRLIAVYKGERWDPNPTNSCKIGTATIDGKQAFIAYWDNITGRGQSSPKSTFQLVLIHRDDIASGDFDIEFNYQSINLNPYNNNTYTAAYIGFASGNSDANAWKLPGSNLADTFRDTDPTPIINYRNTDPDKAFTGRIVLESRNGVITPPTTTTNAFALPSTITLNITAENTADKFSLGGLPISNNTLVINTDTHNPVSREGYTYRLVNRLGGGQFSNIILPSLAEGLGWDLTNLYTTGSFSIVKTPDHLTLFKPTVWLDASDTGTLILDGSKVTKWIDKSGNNNHSQQTDTLKQPQIVTNQINGKPILRFDGTDDYMDFSTQLLEGTTARTIIVLMKKNTPDISQSIYTDTTSTVLQRFEIKSNEVIYNNSDDISFNEVLSDSAYTLLILSIDTARNIGKTYVNKNGVLQRSTTLASALLNTSNAGPSGIGRNNDTNEFLNGDIAELLIYKRKLAPWEIDKINLYFRLKYGNSGSNIGLQLNTF